MSKCTYYIASTMLAAADLRSSRAIVLLHSWFKVDGWLIAVFY